MVENAWFVIWGLLWAIYFMLDGFDLGLGALMPFLAGDEDERRTVYASIGPFWDGNEVWLITAGGVTFAAFPGAYAAIFSALYTPLLLVLFALIIRGAALGLRFESEGMLSRRAWDVCLFCGSSVAAFLFGVAFANIFRGIPIDGEGVFRGTLLDLLNFYGLAGGMLFLVYFMLHGLIWIAIKSEGELMKRAARMASRLYPVLLVLVVGFLVLTFSIGPVRDQYLGHPALFAIPALGALGLVLALVFIRGRRWAAAWACSSLLVMSLVFTGLAGIHPALLPSSIDPAYSVTIEAAASSPYTLKIMLAVALVFVPIVIAYQGWVYRLFRGKAGRGYGFGHE